MISLSKARELENSDAHEALTMYKQLMKDNRYSSTRVWVAGALSALIGYAITLRITERVEMKRIFVLILLGMIAFLPPFILHIREKFRSAPLKEQTGPKIFLSGIFLFLSVLLSPVLIFGAIILGVLILAGPFVLAIKLIIDQPFTMIPRAYGLPFVIPAALIAISYLLSPNRAFSSPFPLDVLFKDALTALFLGFRKVFGIAVGAMFCLSLYWIWEHGLSPASAAWVMMSGMLSGYFLERIGINMKFGYELDLCLARTSEKLGHKYRARYWLGEAAGLLSDDNVSEDMEKEIYELAQKLDLHVGPII